MLFNTCEDIICGHFDKKKQANTQSILLFRKQNFLIFVRARSIMTSQKPNTGYIGIVFGTVSMFRGDS